MQEIIQDIIRTSLMTSYKNLLYQKFSHIVSLRPQKNHCHLLEVKNVYNLMFMVPYILVTHLQLRVQLEVLFMCILVSSLFLAIYVLGAICTHPQEHNCSVQP
jgi:hypothetical protein